MELREEALNEGEDYDGDPSLPGPLWDVPEEERYGIDRRPGDLDVRSLHDDWDCIRFLLEDGEEPIVDQLSEMATLLRYNNSVNELGFAPTTIFSAELRPQRTKV